jgi:hypothetical protein
VVLELVPQLNRNPQATPFTKSVPDVPEAEWRWVGSPENYRGTLLKNSTEHHMSAQYHKPAIFENVADTPDVVTKVRYKATLPKTGALAMGDLQRC